MLILEWREFVKEIKEWINSNPEEAVSLLREAMSDLSANSGAQRALKEAQWAARWARRFWTAAGVDPPRR
jgi:hypothetical protein